MFEFRRRSGMGLPEEAGRQQGFYSYGKRRKREAYTKRKVMRGPCIEKASRKIGAEKRAKRDRA
jgi:hypothetical protein